MGIYNIYKSKIYDIYDNNVERLNLPPEIWTKARISSLSTIQPCTGSPS